MNPQERILQLSNKIDKLEGQVSDLILFTKTLQDQLEEHKNDNHADKKPYWFDEE